VTSVALVVAFGLLGGFVRVPYVALGPGPTYNTLGDDGGAPVIDIAGQRTYPTAGNLNMTTVSVSDHLSMLGALGMWVSGRYALAPREVYYPPTKSEQQIEQENTAAFNDSQTSAEAAAVHHLGYPTKVLVDSVSKDGPADRVLDPGDQLLAINDRPVADSLQVQGAVAGSRPGDEARLTFRRGAEPPRTETVRLATAPDGRPQGYLGLSASGRPDVPFQIKISLADVGGPSAGLMFSLAIVDKLTPGELNGGRFVAGTGEINDAGQVGPIGGIPFKMTMAREAGATVFLVPAGNCAEAKSQAPDGLQLVRVGTLDEAAKALETMNAGGPPPSC